MKEFIAPVYAFADQYLSWLDLKTLTAISPTDVIEIVIIGVILYYFLLWMKRSRAWALMKGILVLLAFLAIAAILQMNTILWLANKLFSVAIIALVIIFQPELRRALEQLGRTNFLANFFSRSFQKDRPDDYTEKTTNEIVKSCYEMSKVRTGALIVIERETPLNEYIRSGIALDSILSSQLIINIFEHNTPLHDGAVIVRGNRIVAATCYLPLSDNMRLSKDLGTRHRAAVGVGEASDAVTIVVSEETGYVSLAAGGVLHRNVDADFLREKLNNLVLTPGTASPLDKFRRRLNDGSKDFKNNNK